MGVMAARALVVLGFLAVSTATLESEQGFSFSLDELEHSSAAIAHEADSEKFCNGPVCFFHDDEPVSFLQGMDDDDFEIMLETRGTPEIEPNKPKVVDKRIVGDAIASMSQDMSPISVEAVNNKMGKDNQLPTGPHPVTTMRLADSETFSVKTFRADLAKYLKIDPIEMRVDARREAGTLVAKVTFLNETERALGSTEL